jgi:hypothetical protein
MKKLLHIMMLLVATFSFGQATLLYHFPFNNSLAATIGGVSLTCNNPVFTSNGSNPTGALRVNVDDNQTSRDLNSVIGSLPLLPQGSSARSIAYKIKFNYLQTENNHCVFMYGSGATSQAFGVQPTNTEDIVNFWGSGYTATFAGLSKQIDVWYDIVITYDPATNYITYYLNGSIYDIKVFYAAAVNTTGTNFAMGRTIASNYGFGKFDIDDLKIYSGVLSESEVAALAIPQSQPATLIYHFPFNGNYDSVVNTGAFACTNLPPFANNLTTPNSAISVNVANSNASRSTDSPTANLALLPKGNAPRSFAFRINYNDLGSEQSVFGYGFNDYNNNGFRYSQTSNNAIVSSSGANNTVSFLTPSAQNVWNNYVVTFDGYSTRVYSDGVQVGSALRQSNQALNTVVQTLVLGKNYHNTGNGFQSAEGSNGSFLLDDLRIYTGVLTNAEISALNVTLSNEKFSKNSFSFNLYPNPANSLLNIDIASEIKNVEIYSLLGQKMFSSTQKQLNISNLASGIYMLKVQDVNGTIATQKFVKK